MSFRMIAGLCVTIGLALAIYIHNWLSTFISLVRPEWYESLYMPLWVASIVCGVLALWARLSTREAIIAGLLITGLPYGWYAIVVTYEYLTTDSEFSRADYFRLAIASLGMAMFGPVLTASLSRIRSVVSGRRGPSSESIPRHQ